MVARFSGLTLSQALAQKAMVSESSDWETPLATSAVPWMTGDVEGQRGSEDIEQRVL